MRDYSFLEFLDEMDTDCTIPLIVSRNRYSKYELAFPFPYKKVYDIVVVDENGDAISGAVDFTRFKRVDSWAFVLSGAFKIPPNTCFCFRLKDADNNYYWSKQIVAIDGGDYTSVVRYRCNESAFGFDYSNPRNANAIRLPIHLNSPQFPQSDKIYQKSNGERKVLFSKVDKEYELETDYMPIEWHEKLIVALSHDEVWINEERLTKTGEYTIDYENEEFTDCGTRLVKASCKMSTNVTLRNSNCS